MALMKCSECGKDMSDSARSCPACGWKRPKTKWWLWVPLGLFGAMLLYGLSIPEYQHVARERRDLCLKLAGPTPYLQRTCESTYQEDIAEGKRRAGK